MAVRSAFLKLWRTDEGGMFNCSKLDQYDELFMSRHPIGKMVNYSYKVYSLKGINVDSAVSYRLETCYFSNWGRQRLGGFS